MSTTTPETPHGAPPDRSNALVRPEYYAKEYARGRWHVIGPGGIPIYNDAPHGNDKPLIFRDEDAAEACAERCNLDDEGPS